MPVRKSGETHRALELLEEYHSGLSGTRDVDLKNAIERVISVFKSSLFQALLDIQEFYEETLVNERKSLDQKTYETQQIAARWENNPPFPASRTPPSLQTTQPAPPSYQAPLAPTEDPALQFIDQERGGVRPGMNGSGVAYNESSGYNNSLLNGSQEERWEYETVVLEKGITGLGFSIAGGSDNPHVANDPSIYVTKIIPGGASAYDGRLRVNDVIMRVNLTDTDRVPHEIAVDALKRAGNVVRLYVKRRAGVSPGQPATQPPVTPQPQVYQQQQQPSPQPPPAVTQQPVYQQPQPGFQQIPTMNAPIGGVKVLPDPRPTTPSHYQGQTVHRMELHKGSGGLGFSIAGGLGNEHVPGDYGIYVTKIVPGLAADRDRRLHVGDKLLGVGEFNMETVTHEQAVAALKAAGDPVVLVYIKNPHPELGLDRSQDGYSQDGRGGTLQQPVPVPFPNQQPAVPAYAQPPQGYAPPPPQPRTPVQSYEQQQPMPMDTMQPGMLTRQPRRLQLNKGPSGLGFNIVGGEDGDGIYISYILPGGAADLCGVVHKGDQLLEVNNVNLRGAPHEAAANALKQSGQVVHLTVQYRPEDYERFEQKIEVLRNEMINQGTMPPPQPRIEMFVRALFDYDPSRDNGLPSTGLAFRYGDILHVTNASDDDWWQARRVLPNGMEEGYGIVPSRKRVEKKERARRKQVNFEGGSGSLGRGGTLEGRRGSRSQLSFSKKFPFMKSKEALTEDTDEHERVEPTYTSVTDESDWPDDMVLSYENVEQISINYLRPIIVLGPPRIKDRINNDLVSHFPDRYGSCVPHTSRPMRPNEQQSRDYHFVSREEMEEDIRQQQFVEAGQFNGNLYGTSINAVREVANQGKHCLLDVSGNAINRLRNAGLHPITVFIRPTRPSQFMDWDRSMTQDEAQRQYERAMKIENDFADAFTAIVQGDTPEDIYAKVKQIIAEQSGPVAWVGIRQ